MQQVKSVLMLATPTPGDEAFYDRWEVIGPVIRPCVVTPEPLFDPLVLPYDTVEVIVTDFRVNINDQLCSVFPNVKYVVSPTTGHTHLTADFKKRGIKLITLRGERAFLDTIWSTAEFTLYAMMRLAREIPPYSRLRGSALGIIGMGRVGHQVKQLGYGYGMIIRSVDKDSTDDAWKALLTESDFITLHVDENPSTVKLINRDKLAFMKPNACLINTSRASVIDQPAVLEALSENHLGGVFLDVYDPSMTLVAMSHPRLLFTEHMAGSVLTDSIRANEYCLNLLKEA